MGFDRKILEQRLAEGKIRGIIDHKPQASAPSAKGVSKKKGDKIKAWMRLQLQHWADAHMQSMETEFQFDTERKWRFDWAIPRMKVAFEYEGIMSKKSRHTTVGGFTGDAEKYNEAAAQGWRVFRYTAANHKQLLKDLDKIV